MKVAVIGSGGREHAIIKKLRQSRDCEAVVALPGNGGMAADAECVPIGASDIAGVISYCRENAVDYVVVAPDDPLVMGMVDALSEAGIPAFGPDKAAARIEGSKVFAKELMQKYGIPTAAYAGFDSMPQALAYIDANQVWPLVVKADGLALGKGVLICAGAEEARAAVHSMMEDKQFGESGSRVVIEQFLTGPEVSVLAFCDGKTLVPMISSMDHKRALDGDGGLNTGGMGTVAPNPYYTAELAERCLREIFLPTLQAMQAEGTPFRGCLYFGLMLTPQGPRVIEYNCRFGDPETQVVLPLLQGDLLEIMLACTNGTLAQQKVEFSAGSAACVVLASEGYPLKYESGLAITVEEPLPPGVELYYAGAARRDRLVTAGGRVVGVTATAETLAEAVQAAYRGAERVHFDNRYYRNDIGKKALDAVKVN